MIYLLLGLGFPKTLPTRRALLAMAISAAIETFQLTGIPLQLRGAGSPLLKAVSIFYFLLFSNS